MNNLKSRLAASVLATAVIMGGSLVLAAGPASAKPMCNVDDPPAACFPHGPKPTPPASLTETVTATPNTPNRFEVQIADHSLVSGYRPGDTTRYNVFLRCDNGYSANGALTYTESNWVPVEVGYAGDLVWSVVAPTGAAAGNCTVTTFDVDALSLHRSAHTLIVEPTSGTSDWWVTFAG